MISNELRAYYDRRALEYDADAYLCDGPPGWSDGMTALERALASLAPARTLDVACGTGYLTRNLPGVVAGVDQSPAMVALTQGRLPEVVVVRGEALALPFADRAFERVVSCHFYGHLHPDERERFLDEARRVAGELVIVEQALRDDVQPDGYEQRPLRDGSRHRIYKRYFTATSLAAELGGGEALLDDEWYVAVRSP